MKTKRNKIRIILILIGGLLGLCILLSIISALSNQNLPQTDVADQLSEVDKARLLEALHLHAQLGNSIWNKFGEVDIPIIITNDAYGFLTGFPGTPPESWALVAGDTFNGESYYRQISYEPQNFAVAVGDEWAASMASKTRTDVFLINTFRDMLPPLIDQIFPYRILIQPSETQIGGVLHEAFHVFQILNAPNKLEAAESAYIFGEQYETIFDTFQSEWDEEAALLADALDAETTQEKMDLVSQFLDRRDERRNKFNLSADLVDYEVWLEWEEGAAKYVELYGLQLAYESDTYQSISAISMDNDFKAYQLFKQRWSQEMILLRQQTISGTTRFYVTGMAQAFLLDDLMPGWKEKYWAEGIFFETLLEMALGK